MQRFPGLKLLLEIVRRNISQFSNALNSHVLFMHVNVDGKVAGRAAREHEPSVNNPANRLRPEPRTQEKHGANKYEE